MLLVRLCLAMNRDPTHHGRGHNRGRGYKVMPLSLTHDTMEHVMSPEVDADTAIECDNVQQTGALTLKQSVLLALPTVHPFLRRVMQMQMLSRWNHVLFQNPRAQLTSVVTSSGRKVVEALPHEEALRHVRSWLPWAVHQLRSEVNLLAASLGGSTDEAVHAGANAPVLDEYDDLVPM